MIKACAIIFFALFCAVDVHAIDAKAKWTHPTARENGTPLAASEIKQYELEWINLASQARRTKLVSGTYQAYTLTGLSEARYGFRIRVYDTGGLISQWSQQVTADIKPPGTTVPVPVPPCSCTCP